MGKEKFHRVPILQKSFRNPMNQRRPESVFFIFELVLCGSIYLVQILALG
jgi:hypothetical protein